MTLSPEAQCERNVKAWLAANPIPLTLLRAESDRCWFLRTPEAENAIRVLVNKLILEPRMAKNHGRDAVGYRETVGNGAAQVVVHLNEIEIDFDYWNPWDVIGIFAHVWEIARNHFGKKKTDPFKVAKHLQKRGIDAEFRPDSIVAG